MLCSFFIRRLSEAKQVNFIKKRGLVLGTRSRNGRQAYVYNYEDIFAEILYQNDNPEEPAETLVWVNGLENLKNYLSKEYRSVA